jgi:hypothetical protein
MSQELLKSFQEAYRNLDLLAEFSRQLRDCYFIVLFSISDTIEMSDVNHINILFAIAVNLMYQTEVNQVEISKSTKDSVCLKKNYYSF